MDAQRSLKIEDALRAGIERWPAYFDQIASATPNVPAQEVGVLRAMPR